jgi:hypothetical protein
VIAADCTYCIDFGVAVTATDLVAAAVSGSSVSELTTSIEASTPVSTASTAMRQRCLIELMQTLDRCCYNSLLRIRFEIVIVQ